MDVQPQKKKNWAGTSDTRTIVIMGMPDQSGPIFALSRLRALRVRDCTPFV